MLLTVLSGQRDISFKMNKCSSSRRTITDPFGIEMDEILPGSQQAPQRLAALA
jgi:hypothetical protein